jgi:hypothetical protein
VVVQNSGDELLHALEVGAGPLDPLAVPAASKFVVILLRFGWQPVADSLFVNGLQQAVAIQTAAEGQ